MPEFFPLSDLRDPVGFLLGARIPIKSTSGNQIEIVGDCALIWDPYTCTYGSCPLEHMDWAWCSLNLSNPDVARWCDRRIADHYLTSQYAPLLHSAALGCTEDLFFLAILGTQGQHSEMALRPHGALSYLASIPCDAAHIPTARAALLRALYGRTP